MPDPDFKSLAQALLSRGIAQRHVNRTVRELRDHYDDLVDAATKGGVDKHTARHQAARQLGSMQEFATAMLAQQELKTWAFRYPRLAIVIYRLATVAVLPAVPVFAGVTHATTLARWAASLLAAGLVTAIMLLAMQLSILFA